MNLMLNAIEAMKEGSGGSELTIKSEAEDGQVLISITDTGVGLSPEQVEQIFKAFFTTKDTGTGMGLPISRSIIESHGGRLWATGVPGAVQLFSSPCPPRLRRTHNFLSRANMVTRPYKSRSEPTVILGLDLFGGQVGNASYLASDYRKLTNDPRLGTSAENGDALPAALGRPQKGRVRLQERRSSINHEITSPKVRRCICGRAASRTSVKPAPMIPRSARSAFLHRVVCRHGE